MVSVIGACRRLPELAIEPNVYVPSAAGQLSAGFVLALCATRNVHKLSVPMGGVSTWHGNVQHLQENRSCPRPCESMKPEKGSGPQVPVSIRIFGAIAVRDNLWPQICVEMFADGHLQYSNTR